MDTLTKNIFENLREPVLKAETAEVERIDADFNSRGVFFSGARIEGIYKSRENALRQTISAVVEAYKKANSSAAKSTVEAAKKDVAEILDAGLLRLKNTMRQAYAQFASTAKLDSEMVSRLEPLRRSIIETTNREVDIWAEMQREKSSLRTLRASSTDAFVIMRIGEKDTDRFYEEVIQPAAQACGLEAKPVNLTEGKETISKRALDIISNSRVVICDLTYERPNCYFEAGYAYGLDVPYLLTARWDHDPRLPNRALDQPKVHFDLDSLNITYWKETELEKARVELEGRIRRALEKSTILAENEQSQETDILLPDVYVLKYVNEKGTKGRFRSYSYHKLALVPTKAVKVNLDVELERTGKTLIARHFFYDRWLRSGLKVEYAGDRVEFTLTNTEQNLERKWAITETGAVIFVTSLGRGDGDKERLGDLIIDAISAIGLSKATLAGMGYRGNVKIISQVVWPSVSLMPESPCDAHDINDHEPGCYDQLVGIKFEEKQSKSRPAVSQEERIVLVGHLSNPLEFLTEAYANHLRSTRAARIDTKKLRDEVQRLIQVCNVDYSPMETQPREIGPGQKK